MILFLSFLLFSPLSTSAPVDSCDFVDEDYCFYFGESTCYQKICDCTLSKCGDNCTVPVFCSIGGTFNVSDESIARIPLDCFSLKESCVSQRYFNGYCFFHKKRCPFDAEVEQKSKEHYVITDNCPKWQSTCEKKWKKHHACKQFRKHCKHLRHNENNGTEVISNSTEVVQPSLSQTHVKATHLPSTGPNWERNMKRRCREWRKKCKKDPKSSACGRVSERCETFDGRLEDPVVSVLNATDSTKIFFI